MFRLQLIYQLDLKNQRMVTRSHKIIVLYLLQPVLQRTISLEVRCELFNLRVRLLIRDLRAGTAAVANISVPRGSIATPIVRSTPVSHVQASTTTAGSATSA